MPITDPLSDHLHAARYALSARVNLDIAPTAHTRVDLVYGAQATIDFCCPNGYGWVRPVRTFPYVSFPTPVTEFTNCPTFSLACEVELGIARCSASLDENGNPPTQTEIEAVSDLVGLDRSALHQTVLCDLLDRFEGELVSGSWTPLPDSGGCTGGTITVIFPYDHCCDEPAA